MNQKECVVEVLASLGGMATLLLALGVVKPRLLA